MTKNHSGNAVEPIVKQFDIVESSTQPKWLLPLRKNGINRFSELGFPTLQDEDWRFTNVTPIEKLTFTPAKEIAVNGAESKVLSEAAFTKLAGNRLVFVNGFFSAKLSSIKPVGKSVRIENLSVALAQDSALIEKHLGKYAHTKDNSFAAL